MTRDAVAGNFRSSNLGDRIRGPAQAGVRWLRLVQRDAKFVFHLILWVNFPFILPLTWFVSIPVAGPGIRDSIPASTRMDLYKS